MPEAPLALATLEPAEVPGDANSPTCSLSDLKLLVYAALGYRDLHDVEGGGISQRLLLLICRVWMRPMLLQPGIKV